MPTPRICSSCAQRPTIPQRPREQQSAALPSPTRRQALPNPGATRRPTAAVSDEGAAQLGIQLQRRPSGHGHVREPPAHTPSQHTRLRSKTTEARSASQPRKAKKKVCCGNNRLDPTLKANGGTLDVGSRSACFRSGFGAALYQHVQDEEAFVKKLSVPYEHLIPQKLWYKDSPPPAGYQPATLSQARLRGWGAGSAALACKLREKRHGRSADGPSQ